MFNVCPGCGAYSVDKVAHVDGPEAHAVCGACGHAHPFLRLPLFFITHASGTGKTTLALELVRRRPGVAIMESDILWDDRTAELTATAAGAQAWRDQWLRVAKNIAQAGTPVCIAGSATPERFEASPERRYFAATHYLALVCSSDVLRRRLETRPPWRRSAAPEVVDRMLRFNDWITRHAATTAPPMTVLDTTSDSTDQTATAARAWIEAGLRDVTAVDDAPERR